MRVSQQEVKHSYGYIPGNWKMSIVNQFNKYEAYFEGPSRCTVPSLCFTKQYDPAPSDNLRAQSWSYECLSATCPGFDILQRLLVGHAHMPQVYGALAALLLGKKAPHATEGQVRSRAGAESETPYTLDTFVCWSIL